MSNRDRAERDLAMERVVNLTTALDATLAERDTLKSECVRLGIREKDLVARLAAAEREVRAKDAELERLHREQRRGLAS